MDMERGGGRRSLLHALTLELERLFFSNKKKAALFFIKEKNWNWNCGTVKLRNCFLLCSVCLSIYLLLLLLLRARGCNPRSMDLGGFCKNELYKNGKQRH